MSEPQTILVQPHTEVVWAVLQKSDMDEATSRLMQQEVPAAATASSRAVPPPVRAASKSARTSAATEEESALVVDAVRALRRDHDPRRAKDLAEEVLQRYPRGAQCEEAMAVAMEAASLDGDELTARRWAERYLESFGAGRFADRARDVLAASPR